MAPFFTGKDNSGIEFSQSQKKRCVIPAQQIIISGALLVRAV